MENASLTKSQLCWVIIRVFGVVLIYKGVVGTPGALGAIMTMSKLSGKGLGSTMILFGVVVALVVPVVLISVGAMLLSRGTRLHAILMRGVPNYQFSERTPEPPKRAKPRKEKVDPTTQLTESEMVEFKKWLAENSEIQSEELVNQVAMFRDYKRES